MKIKKKSIGLPRYADNLPGWILLVHGQALMDSIPFQKDIMNKATSSSKKKVGKAVSEEWCVWYFVMWIAGQALTRFLLFIKQRRKGKLQKSPHVYHHDSFNWILFLLLLPTQQ